MWFEDEELLGRRLRGRHKKRPKSVLNVKLDMKSPAVRQKIAVFFFVPFICIAATAVVWFVWGAGKKVLFTENNLFRLRELEIVVDPTAVITPQIIREHAGLKPGMNLFEIPVKKIRSEFLANMPNIKVMEIRRQLPGTLRIKIVEREPMARVGRKGWLAMDEDGYVFVKKTGLEKLPVVYGHRGAMLRPGGRVKGMTYAAVQILDSCNDPRFESLDVAAVDVGGSDYITLWLSGNKSAILSWSEMGKDTEVSWENLSFKLEKFSLALETDEGKSKSRFDLTFSDDVYAE